MHNWIVPDAVLCGVGPGWRVASNRCRQVDVAALVKQTLRVRRFMTHFRRQATDSLGFREQSAHFPQQRSSALWVRRIL
jgi:hypothetical protein